MDIRRRRENKLDLKYYVFYHDFNGKKIKPINIFEHGRFLNDVEKDLKKCSNKEEFSEVLKGTLFYYYCSKCEWEIIITSWTPHISIQELNRLNQERIDSLEKYDHEPYTLHVNPDVAEKIDIYDQVMLNWDLFLNYVWSYKDKK